MPTSAYNGQNRFDFEFAEANYFRRPPVAAVHFLGVLPQSREYTLRPEVIAPLGHRFGVSRLITTMASGTITMLRRTVSKRWWWLIFVISVANTLFTLTLVGRFGDVLSAYFTLTLTGSFTFLVLMYWRQDLMFQIDESNVTMRKGRGAEVTRPTADIQHCEYAWVHGEGESASLDHVVVVFNEGSRFDTLQYTEIFRAVHWFCPGIPLLDVPQSTQKFMPTEALRPSEPGQDRHWRWYQESRERREKNLSSSE